MNFMGFTTEDFDAYLPEKWSSNMFTLGRRKVKDKLEQMGTELSAAFETRNIGLEMHLSDDHPSLWNKKQVSAQWLFFSRDLSAQKEVSEIIDTEKTLSKTLEDPTPLYRQIFLGAKVDKDGIEQGIRLSFDAWVDRKNALAILSDNDKCAHFVAMCKALSFPCVIALSENSILAAADMTVDSVQAIVRQFEDSQDSLFIGSKIGRDQILESAGQSVEQFTGPVVELLEAYTFLSWSPDNDAVSIGNIVEEKKQQKEERHQALEREKEERARAFSKTREERVAQKDQRLQEMLEEQDWQQKDRARRRAAAQSKREQAEEAWKQAMAAKSNAPAPATTSAKVEAPAVTDTQNVDAKAHAKANGKPQAKDISDSRPSRLERFRNRDAKRDNTRQGKGQPSAARGKGKAGKFSSGGKAPAPPKVSKERMAQIEEGDRIKVEQGFLKGKVGVVQSIEEDGSLKVSFGMLSSRVNREDVQGLGPSK